MSVQLYNQFPLSKYLPKAYLINDIKEAEAMLQIDTKQILLRQVEQKASLLKIYVGAFPIFFITASDKKHIYQQAEYYRKKGAELTHALNAEGFESVEIENLTGNQAFLLALAEGLSLANYQFLKYKSVPKVNTFKDAYLPQAEDYELEELQNLVYTVLKARDLVNEPVIYLTAEKFSEELTNLAEEAGVSIEVLNKKQIESLKMGGLLAINFGAPNPPTFNILEYKPAQARNSQPVVLVGKGVVYDTGGLSLKDTANSMDIMKCDMAGAAAIAGAILALAHNKVPVHVVGLIPATENRLDGNAITPGDVITMFDGKTVEILNTDAEGRVILADALAYAKKYNPTLVIDVATLTGAAIMAVGPEGSIMMGTAEEDIMSALKMAGNEVYERLVELPLWEEYDKHTESDIADLKNLGNGPQAGAISAGKFLEKFTAYPWVHLDIAGPAYIKGPDSYRGKNGTGMGVRLLYRFLSDMKF